MKDFCQSKNCKRKLRYTSVQREIYGNFCVPCNGKANKVAMCKQKIHHINQRMMVTMSTTERRALDWKLMKERQELDKLLT